MAQERVTGFGSEVLHSGGPTTARVTATAAEVLHGGGTTTARITALGVEVLRSAFGQHVSSVGLEVLRSLTIAPPSGQPSYMLYSVGQQFGANGAGNYGVWTTAGSIANTGTAETGQTAMLRAGGIFSNMLMKVSQNSAGITSTVRFRKNGVSGYMALSIPTTATGFFEDVADTDTAVSGDAIGYQLLFASGGGTITLQAVALKFVPDSAKTITYGVSYWDSDGYFLSGSGTDYAQFFDPRGGAMTGSTIGLDQTEGRIGRATGTLTNYRVRVGTNPTTASSTATLMTTQGTSSTGLTVTIPTGTSGFFEDVSNSYTLSSEVGLIGKFVIGTNPSGLFRCLGQQVAFTSADAKHDFTAIIRNGVTGVTTGFYALFDTGQQSTEAPSQARAPFDFRWTNLRYYTVAHTGTSTFKSRINGADGHQAVSITGSGWFEDATGVDLIGKGDLFNMTITGGTTRIASLWGSTVRENVRVEDCNYIILE